MKRFDISKVYHSKNTVFTAKDIALIWKETDLNTLKARINYYVKTGRLYSLRRGIYAKDKNYNKFELAVKIYTPSYVSLETVLQKERVIFQHYKDIFVVSYLTREIVCDNERYVFKKIKNSVLTNSLGIKKKENYSIATKERAFMDTLYLYKDYHFDNLESMNWEDCFQILPLYSNKTLTKRLNSYYKNVKY